MYAYRDTLEDLGIRAREGDGVALAELRQELQGHLIPLVRTVLGIGRGTTPFQRHVLTTARHLARYVGDGKPDLERLIRRVASCLCEAMCASITRGPSANVHCRETVRI